MPLDIPSLFAGAGAGVLGALAGAWATVRLGFVFQRRLQEEQQRFQQKLLDDQLAFQERLLKQQLDFEKALSAQSEEEVKKRHEKSMEVLTYLRDTLNTKMRFLDGNLSAIAARLDEIAKRK